MSSPSHSDPGPAGDPRRYRRYRVLKIGGTLSSPGDVRLLDLSRTGMALETIEELHVGERYFLELRHAGHTVNLEVEVKWCSPRQARSADGDPMAVHRAGVAFRDIHRESLGGLWQSIQVGDEATEP